MSLDVYLVIMNSSSWTRLNRLKKEKYIMLEYAEKIDELLDDACNKLSGEMFNKLLEYVENIVENHR